MTDQKELSPEEIKEVLRKVLSLPPKEGLILLKTKYKGRASKLLEYFRKDSELADLSLAVARHLYASPHLKNKGK